MLWPQQRSLLFVGGCSKGTDRPSPQVSTYLGVLWTEAQKTRMLKGQSLQELGEGSACGGGDSARGEGSKPRTMGAV